MVYITYQVTKSNCIFRIMIRLFSKIIPRWYGLYFNTLALFSKKLVAKKAFKLFCTIRKGKVLPQQADFLNAARNETLEIAAHSIQTYRWSGNKETILLIHGWESNSFRWHKLIKKLKQADYNVIAFDAPAHGYSSGKQLYLPLYAEVLQGLIQRYQPQSLVGHSMGGMTIIYNEYKNRNPSIGKTVTVASPSEFHELMEHYQKLLKFNNSVMNALDSYIYDRFGFHIREFSTSEYIKTNTSTGLLFHDQYDKITPYHASQKVQANWKDSKLITTVGLGHSMHQDEVNAQIVDFLNS